MNKVLKSSFIIILVILLSKVLGFIREFCIVYVFGVSYKTDAFLEASVVPQLLFSTIDLAFAAVLIPIIQEIKLKDKEKLPGFVLALSVSTSLVLVIVTLIGLIFNNTIINIVAAGSASNVKTLAIVLTQIMMPMIIFQGIIQILIAALRVLDRPIIGNFIGIPYNILIILGIFLGKDYLGVYGVSIFIVLGTLLQALLLVIYCIKLNVYNRFKFSEQKIYLKKVVILGVPTLLSTLFAQLQVVTERVLASHLETGSITIVFYVNKLFTLVIFIILTLINSVLYPKMTSWALNNKNGEFEKNMGGIIKYTIMILFPASIFLILNAHEIVFLVLGNGHVDTKSLVTISKGFGFASLGLIVLILKDILLKILFSVQKVAIATRLSVISIVISIILSIVLVNLYGVYGIILATPLATFITVFLLMYILNKKVKIHLNFSFSLFEIIWLLTIGVFIFLGNNLIKSYIQNIYINVSINCLIFIGLFGLSYLIVSKFFPKNGMLGLEK
ncbi:murein biosynthesis integral membrane protein MurJ [Neobacillus cucumis]|uniref:murein biosynthesis integral membrane protein MurJ n=1 Tax=Neobacillus cucumis TaxID=1740721 RepID=UPI001963FBBF|nr:murein biosynthesis integral membrane protein MurJ [Neobacillus cucumis]MBM7652546.1 putative peptidoglycan lipid II flippase [Neobacillus cucumis]